MGHLVGKEIYQELGDKIDSLPFRVNKNKALFNILKELYTSEEADLVVNMPHALSSADQIEKAARIEKSKLNALLESLCTKGLVIDIWIDNKYPEENQRKDYMEKNFIPDVDFGFDNFEEFIIKREELMKNRYESILKF